MKKRTLSLLLAIVMLLSAFSLFACGDKPDDEEAKTDDPVVDPTPDEPEEPEEPDETEEPDDGEEPGVPTDINMDSEYPVKRIDLYTTELSHYVIVYADGAEDRIVHAATELASYLQQAAGYEIPIITDATAAVAHEILVGPTNRDTEAVTSRRDTLCNDGIMYYVENGKLYLGSCNALGTEYAVYHFLNDYIGWRCLSNHYEVFHEASYVRIPKDLDYSYSPSLTYRKTDWGLYETTNCKYSLNGDADTAHQIIGFCHTMAALAECSADTQPCLTSEATFQTVLKNLRAWIEANPGCRWVSVTQNDNSNYCNCSNCRAIADKENQSGVMLTFVNRLADAIKDEYPDVSLVTFAYMYTRQAPVTIVPRDNVIVWMCSIECCFSHALDDPDCEQNADFCKDLQDWMAITDRIMFWDYTTDYTFYIMPFPNLKVIQKNASLLASAAVGIYEEGNYQMESAGEFSELRSYMLAKLLWNPGMTEEEYNAILLEYCNDYYGPGGKYVYEYIMETSDKAAEHHMGIFYSLDDDGCLFLKEDGTVDRKFIAKMAKLWDKAYAAAETDEQRNHITYNRLQCDLMELVSTASTGTVDTEGALTYLYKLKDLQAGGLNCICEWGYETRCIDHIIGNKYYLNPRKW